MYNIFVLKIEKLLNTIFQIMCFLYVRKIAAKENWPPGQGQGLV